VDRKKTGKPRKEKTQKPVMPRKQRKPIHHRACQAREKGKQRAGEKTQKFIQKGAGGAIFRKTFREKDFQVKGTVNEKKGMTEGKKTHGEIFEKEKKLQLLPFRDFFRRKKSWGRPEKKGKAKTTRR